MFKKFLSCLLISALLLNPAYEARASVFTTVFGGSPVSPSDVAYASYSFGSSLKLYWPQFSVNNPNIAARFMNMTATASSLNVNMPDATLYSTGYDTIIFNAGSNSFNVVTLNGNAIVTIAPGQTYYILLNGNSTQDGTWQTVQFGVGTGSANASALAGSGLIALAGLLNVNLSANTVSNSFTITSSGRGMLYVWTGGAGTATLPLASTVGNGFVVALANNGSGSVTVTPTGGNTIDGNSTSVFSQTQSGFLISNGSGWSTVGKGIQNTFAVTILNISVAGSADVTETSAQAQNIIQQYTGALTGNINVIVPATAQLYIANNLTSGAYTLTVKTAAGTGIQVAQGATAILYCDGTNVVNAYTASIGGTLSLVAGSAASPSLSIQGSLSTGLYSPAANQVAVSANGFRVMNFLSAASSVNYLQSSASATGNPVSIAALGTDTDIGITLTPKGAGTVNIAALNATGGTVDNAVIGGATPAAITGTSIIATGNSTAAAFIPTGASAPSNGMYLSAANNVTVGANSGATKLTVDNTNGSITANSAYTVTGGVGANIANSSHVAQANSQMLLNNNATSPAGFGFYTGAEQWKQLNVAHTANAVNNLSVTGSTTGNPLAITATGTDTNIGIALTPKGTGAITAVTPSASDSSTKVATTAFVNSTALTLTNGTTAATQAVNDSSAKVATTAFVNPASTLAGTGYIKYPNGLIMNWGGTASIGSGGSGTTSYAQAFSVATYSVVITPTVVGTSSAQSAVTSISTTGFTMTNATTANQAFYYLAIGQ